MFIYIYTILIKLYVNNYNLKKVFDFILSIDVDINLSEHMT